MSLHIKELLLGGIVAVGALASPGATSALSNAAEAMATHGSADRLTIGGFAEQAGNFTTLLALAEAAGLSEALVGDDQLTVFAPTDAAFAALPEQTRANLLQVRNRELLKTILLYHAVEGGRDSASLLGTSGAKTLQGTRVDAELREGRFQIDGANVVANDVRVTNGVIHAIDRVLIPEGVDPNTNAGRLVIGIYNERPGAALRAQLGLDRGTGLVVTGLVDGQPSEGVLERYDVITLVNGEPATDHVLDRAKEHAGLDGTIELTIFRGGTSQTKIVGVGLERH